MLEWDSRMKNDHSVKVLKTVIPFFDVAVGECIDMEGLLTAVRPLASRRERSVLDMILGFFQMRRMMQMMQVMQAMQSGEPEDGEESGPPSDMFDMLKGFLTPEQQETFESMSAMMSMMQMSEQAESGEEDGTVDL